MNVRKYIGHVLFSAALLVGANSCSPSEPETKTIPTPAPAAPAKVAATEIPAEIKPLLTKNTCLGCHKVDKKLVGPSYKDVAARGYSVEELVALIKEPVPSNWPDYTPMAPMQWVAEEDLVTIATWITTLGEE